MMSNACCMFFNICVENFDPVWYRYLFGTSIGLVSVSLAGGIKFMGWGIPKSCLDQQKRCFSTLKMVIADLDNQGIRCFFGTAPMNRY